MLTLVTGPPCAGKTRHVADHRRPGDLVLDLDAIAHALGYPGRQIRYGDHHPVAAAARVARTAVLQALAAGQITGTAWIIETKPSRTQLAIYKRRGARVLTLDPGRDVCHRRADEDERPEGTHEQIDAWYDGGALGIFN